MTYLLVITAFGAIVWAGCMTFLYLVVARDLREAKEHIAGMEYFCQAADRKAASDKETIADLRRKIGQYMPWMLPAEVR